MNNQEQQLAEIAEEINHCTRCSLYQKATQAVPGEGNPQSEVMFIGEGPGFWEDKEGRPFVGQAGKLLNKLLELIKLPRKEVFIGNVVKHRPPENRDPLPQEIEACAPFLDQQIKIINPKIIVTLGRFSLSKFLPGE
ncbi:MAG: uracil-DNA glycosylase, partial [Candidatus Shapirobacteria bacterium]|nr:uracil-DNA glycosylase [Candidatus Shapirobacteria bacterium]